MKRQRHMIFNLILILVTTLWIPSIAPASTANQKKQITWPKGPSVYAHGAIIMEASSGLVLYNKNIKDKMYPASITKVMTSLIAIEHCSLSEIVTFSHDAIFGVEPGSTILGGTDVGEQLTMQQCLYAILLESANEVSNAVAEHVAGSIPAFADMMNEKAKSLGCVNTHFVNPHGLHNNDHYTCAYDMALITKEAMKNETFCKIFKTRTYQIPPTNKQSETRYLRNHHKFILKEKYLYDGCIGGKTGYTTNAGNTLVTVIKRSNMELICVILKDDGIAHQYGDTQKLLDFGFDNFSIYPVKDFISTSFFNESPLFTKFSPLLNENEPPFVTDENGYLVLPNSTPMEAAKKTVTFNMDGVSLKVGSVIGRISYTYQKKYVGGADIIINNTDNLITDANNKTKLNISSPSGTHEASTKTNVKKSGKLLPVVLGIIIGIILLIIILYYIIVEKPRLKRRHAYYRKKAHRKRYGHDDFYNL
jgi:D-alanyl-D-alanine carboxypeptidase (penicillin-binding protein 5/6)